MEKDQFKEAEFGYRTDFLFSTSSFLSGMGSVLSLGGSFYRFNGSKTGEIADNTAIENDFRVIGQDLRKAVKVIMKEKELKLD